MDTIFCHFGLFFCIFTPLTIQKIKILKKWKKKSLEISSFYNSVPKIMIILCYTVPKIWCMTNVIIFHLGRFLPFYPFNSSKNKKIINKTPGDILILHICAKNYDQMIYISWDMVRDRRTDRWTEKVTYRGGCPTSKNTFHSTVICDIVLKTNIVLILKMYHITKISYS